MKASELIIALQEIINKKGDLPVIYWHETEDSLHQIPVTEVNIFRDCSLEQQIELI